MAEKMTALITGSYGGLGVCFVNIHAAKGGDLILVGRNQAKLDAQKEETEKKYQVTVHTIAADLSQPDFLDAWRLPQSITALYSGILIWRYRLSAITNPCGIISSRSCQGGLRNWI